MKSSSLPLIFVLEDDEFLSKIFEVKFSKAGFKVESFHRGKPLLERLSSKVPQIMVLDFFLPDMTGQEILKKIRLEDKYNAIKIVMVSNHDDEKIKKECLSQGAQEYLCKVNISIKDLVERTKSLL